jgi:hypothetical protein
MGGEGVILLKFEAMGFGIASSLLPTSATQTRRVNSFKPSAGVAANWRTVRRFWYPMLVGLMYLIPGIAWQARS